MAKNVEQCGLASAGSATDKDGLAARNLLGKKLRKRARQRPASDQVIDGEMAAGELANDHRRRVANDRRNHRCKAAPIRELRVEQRVVFVEFLAQFVGNDFEPRAQTRRIELDGGSCRRIPSRSYHQVESGLPMISLTLSSTRAFPSMM